MSAKAFLDSNVLVYAFSADSKRTQAEAVLIAGGTISVQVLNEFVNVARRKLALAWSGIEQALAIVRVLVDEPVPVTLGVHNAALLLARKHGLNFYDALIVAAAQEAKCSVLYTEDLHDGMKFGSLTVRNPFATP